MTGSFTRARAGVAALTLVAGFGALAVLAAPASAAPTTRYVATTGDDTENDCTDSANPCEHVQYAVDQANAGDTIRIAGGEYRESVEIRKPLTLQGTGSSGSGKTVIDGNPKSGDASILLNGLDVNETVVVTVKDVAVDGNSDNDGIEVEGDATLHLIDSTASNNNDTGVSLASPATATIDDSTVNDNGQYGVGTFNQRGLAPGDRRPLGAAAGLTITGSTISHNNRDGVAVANLTANIDHSTINQNGDGGVVVYSEGVANISTSTLNANVGGGFVLANFSANSGSLFSSTVSNTVPFTSEGEGPPVAFGGGVLNLGGTLDISNSTIVGNTGQGVLNSTVSGEGGGAAITTIENSTINGTKASVDDLPTGGIATATQVAPQVRAAHTAGTPRGRFGSGKLATRAAAPAQPSVSVVGTIVAEQATTKVPDCNGTIIDGGYNLSSDAANSCKFTAAKHDQVKTDPLLGPLADNGGPTQTEILKKLSPAIDAIPAGQANCADGATDQRGIDRPQPSGGKCDVGAVELAAKALAIHPDSLPDGTVGTPYHATITATGGQYPIYTFAFVSGSLPDGLALSSDGKITGTPTQAGTFHFTVSVNDPVLKAYTIVIADAAAPSSSSAADPVSNTGAHTGPLLAVGGAAVLAGVLMLLWVGVLDRRARGPRMVYGRHHKK